MPNINEFPTFVSNKDLPSEEFPTLSRTVRPDLVAPQAADRQARALEKRDITIVKWLRSIIAYINNINTILGDFFVRRDGGNFMQGHLPVGDGTSNFKVINMATGSAATDAAAVGQVLLRNGANSATGSLNMGNQYIGNMHDPASPQDAATKNYVDSLTTGFLGRNVCITTPGAGSWTFPALVTRVLVVVQGGQGGGGGASAAGSFAVGYAGAMGGIVAFWLNGSPGSTISYFVGGGGGGGNTVDDGGGGNDAGGGGGGGGGNTRVTTVLLPNGFVVAAGGGGGAGGKGRNSTSSSAGRGGDSNSPGTIGADNPGGTAVGTAGTNDGLSIDSSLIGIGGKDNAAGLTVATEGKATSVAIIRGYAYPFKYYYGPTGTGYGGQSPSASGQPGENGSVTIFY